MMTPMPKSSIELMSHFGTVHITPISTGRMAVSLPQMLDPDISQLLSPKF